MRILFWVAGITAVIIVWCVIVRPLIRDAEWAKPFFVAIEPAELWLYSKSETILWARWQQFVGFVLFVTGALGGIDYTLLIVVTPESWHPWLRLMPLILNVTGTVAEMLRRDTSKPLAVVALPEAKPPEVVAAVTLVEAANTKAVEVVKEAKAGGSV